ncbi:hypothetical protein A2454_01820 [Candidatus Peribacteria bacterium RIFOXYC2_FULL_55_14]|nr:MAG: Ig domain-containing protein [Candidatus Peribacteria bacterium GW2011_GWB1_54_5]KKW40362.1 MAG: Ig domain-containing protein [Candidatus Peribacteria bacterium GW2011_GWC2_54_8]KKW44523.1 MAG: Ig domain-containing protein [Candidatus Peregrinibacteria bacterium GW2011_GWA2_54_9]OGJ72412.1 MAG: hypothetical protein A2198_06445 [Candidatus Peribacteria bacterium RIFOXYA1_FULL_56_14]OGJ73461.1 MAG: hypothetical protein A2217_02000 [Candidatus Peribacteria bacterium RIFOXYA2_FULL_55_28]OG
MRRLLITLGAFLIPLGAQALDYRDQSLMYLDAPFLPAEAAGISVLTTIGAVEGNPDGTFQPRRTLNRAEFLKIALASYPRIVVSLSDASGCFPDVREEDWFSRYVCLAKKRGVVSGYPDGFFRPENPVNYAEALKMLGELYAYTAYADADAEWFEIYVQAAQNHRTALPVNLAYDRYLTRGQMARLAAAFRAEYEGELNYYRRAERGEDVVVSEEAEPEPEEEEPLPPSPRKESLVPVKSSFLMVGQRGPIADFQLFTRENPVELRIVKVTLEREARTLSGIYLFTGSGKEIAKLKLDVYDRDDETWIVSFEPGQSGLILSERTGSTFVLQAQLRRLHERGFSEEWVKVKKMFVMVGEVVDPTVQYQIVPASAHYPAHQTVQARITRVENLLSSTGSLDQGAGKHFASFLFETEKDPVADFRVRHLRFHVHNAPGIRVTNWELRGEGTERRYACNTEESDSQELSLVDCFAIPEELGRLGILDLYGDVDLSQASHGDTLQVNLEVPGSLSESGDVRWTDGSADYQWIESPAPVAEGRVWRY